MDIAILMFVHSLTVLVGVFVGYKVTYSCIVEQEECETIDRDENSFFDFVKKEKEEIVEDEHKKDEDYGRRHAFYD